jgi:hypothetical protein
LSHKYNGAGPIKAPRFDVRGAAAKKLRIKPSAQFALPNLEVSACGLICWLRPGWGFQPLFMALFFFCITYNKGARPIKASVRTIEAQEKRQFADAYDAALPCS